MKRILILTMIGVFTSAGAVFAGWEIESRIRKEVRVVYIGKNHLKSVFQNYMTLYDLDNRTVAFIRSDKKAYWQGGADEFAAAAREHMTDVDRLVREQDLSSEKAETIRKMMEETLKQRERTPPIPVSVKEIPEYDSVAGYRVQKFEVWTGEKLTLDLWIARGVDFGVIFDVPTFQEMRRVMFADFGPMYEQVILSAPAVTTVLKKGWPLRKIRYRHDTEIELEEARRVTKKSLTDDLFSPPPAYTEAPLEIIFQE